MLLLELHALTPVARSYALLTWTINEPHLPEERQTYTGMLCKVIHCVGCDSAITKPCQLHWSDRKLCTIQSRMIVCLECVSTTIWWYMVTWGMSGVLGWWVAVPACARHTSLTPTHVPHDGSPQRHRRGDCLRREVDICYPAQVLTPHVCVCVCVCVYTT